RVNLVNYGEIHIRGLFVLTDAFHLIRLRLRLASGPEHFGKDRPLRVGPDDLDLRVLLFEESGDARDGSPGADANDNVRHLALSLFPDFRTGRFVVRLRI